MDTKKQIEAALIAAEKDRKWLADASGYSYYSVRDCLAPEGKKLSKRMFTAFMDAIARARAAEAASPTENLPDRITLLVDPEKHALWDAAAKASDAPTTSAWAVDHLNAAAEEWARSRELQLLPPYAADHGDGENKPSRGSGTYPSGRSKPLR